MNRLIPPLAALALATACLVPPALAEDAGAIRRAIEAGCAGVQDVGAATRAGTNCGSCRPEIAALIAAHAALEPA